jgi:hypothetical protein
MIRKLTICIILLFSIFSSQLLAQVGGNSLDSMIMENYDTETKRLMVLE